MTYESWHAFYYAGWQWPWALLVVPFFWSVVRSVAAGPRPADEAARFVRLWSTLFLFETMLDPLANGWAKGAGAGPEQAVAVLFVLLGDLRIYWLVFALGRPGGSAMRALGWAALASAGVPVVAWLATSAFALAGELPGQVLWLTHELLFVAVAVWLARRWVPGAAGAHVRFVQRVLGYVAGYYALWAAADVLILCEVDAGWLVRTVPNQLYYAFTVPVVEVAFRASSSAAASTSTQAER